MKTQLFKFMPLVILVIIALTACTPNQKKEQNDFSPKLQALSLSGDSLFSASPSEKVIKNYKLAKTIYDANTKNPDNLIWLGRWTAYTGDYLGAIKIFTKGIEQFPNDARFYRHRGHRYISIRKFNDAIVDLEYAMKLIEDQPDVVEPDGMPNAMNQPISSLHSNIRYHLGLAYYLTHQLDKALEVYKTDINLATNDDQIVSTSHWLYMTLRLLGHNEEAEKVLEPITRELNIFENFDYHQLLLLYKGELIDTDLLGEDYTVNVSEGMAYGIANWYFYNGQTDKAKTMLEKILSGKQWASFGYIAAEADYLEYFKL